MKLNLGSGACPLAGYTNVDLAYEGWPAASDPQPDGISRVCSQIYPLPKSFTGKADVLRCSHALEHFPHREVMDVLADWVRCLAPGGWLRVAVPDLPKVIAAYENGDPKALFYLMGGQTDEYDFHKAAFDEETLRAAFEQLGLEDIRPWHDGARDCSSLPVSLNLEGRKPGGEPLAEAVEEPNEPEYDEIELDTSGIVAVMTCPRLGFTDCSHSQYAAFGGLGIPLLRCGGVFWDQGISRVIEQALCAGARYVVTVDYDSLFFKEDVVRLLVTMEQHPEIDALAALQMRREMNSPLFHLGRARNSDAPEELELSYSELTENDTLQARTAHLGLTVFRAERFARVQRPWFQNVPDPDGGWGEGRMDSDIAFWHRWGDAGNSLHIALRVPIGHLEQVVSWPDRGLQRRMQGMGEWNASGKPEWAWR